jgi:hypothetical protein
MKYGTEAIKVEISNATIILIKRKLFRKKKRKIETVIILK